MDKEVYDRETAEIKRLQAMSTKGMTSESFESHLTALKDAYWRRRMAARTAEEVARGVVAP